MDVREALIRSGTELLEAEGLGALTLRRIARAAGVSHGAPRHHFPTYESLLAAIARRGLETLDAALREAASEDLGVRPTLAALGTTYLDFAARHPGMFELIARHDLLEGAGGHLREISGPWLERVTRLTGDPTRALALWSGVHGLAVLGRGRTADPVLTEVPPASEVLDALVEALT